MTEDELMDPQPLPDTLPAEDDGSEALESLARSLEEELSAEEAERVEELVTPAEDEKPGEPEPPVELEDEAPTPLEPAAEIAPAEESAAEESAVDESSEPEEPAPAPSETEEPAPAPAPAEEPEEPVERRTRVAWWPFIVHGVLWIGLAGSSYVLLTGAQVDLPAFRQDSYPYLVLAGLVLTLLGPLIALAVWLFAWFKAKKPERGGMLTAALVRGSIVTFLGVVVWWGVLVLVDALRLGLV